MNLLMGRDIQISPQEMFCEGQYSTVQFHIYVLYIIVVIRITNKLVCFHDDLYVAFLNEYS